MTLPLQPILIMGRGSAIWAKVYRLKVAFLNKELYIVMTDNNIWALILRQ